jgi:hypothetical protein
VNSEEPSETFHFSLFTIHLLVFSMHAVTAAAAAKLFKLKPSGRVLLVFCRHVIALFALGALQNYVISRHFFSSFVLRH